MNAVDIILIAVVLLMLTLAVRKCIQDHKNGKNCGGNCAQCSRICKKK